METLRRSRNTITVVTANVYVLDLDLFVTVQILDDTPALLSLGMLYDEHGYTHEWAIGQKPHMTKDGKKIICKTENFVPLVVPGLSSNSGTSSSFTSLPQDSSSTSSCPATERCDELAPGNWHDSPKTQNKNKKRDINRASEARLRDLPEWSKKFKENLQDTEVLPPAHISHDLDSERPTKVAPRSTVFLLASQKTEIATYACEPR